MPTRAPVTDPATFKTICPCCGVLFLSHEVGKRGAPREYCSPDCRKAMDAWRAFVIAFDAVLGRLTIKRLFEWRGELIGMASKRAWNRGIGRMSKEEAIRAEDVAGVGRVNAQIVAMRA